MTGNVIATAGTPGENNSEGNQASLNNRKGPGP